MIINLEKGCDPEKESGQEGWFPEEQGFVGRRAAVEEEGDGQRERG